MSRIKVVRKRTPRRKRIIQTHNRWSNGQPERRDGGCIFVKIHADEVVRDSSPDPNRCLAISCRVPRDAGSRLEILPLALHPRLSMKSWIAGIAETRRRIRNYRTLNPLVEVRKAEGVNIGVTELANAVQASAEIGSVARWTRSALALAVLAFGVANT